MDGHLLRDVLHRDCKFVLSIYLSMEKHINTGPPMTAIE